jgi:hypothetical protein
LTPKNPAGPPISFQWTHPSTWAALALGAETMKTGTSAHTAIVRTAIFFFIK